MFQSLKYHYVEPIRSFDRAARLFLLMTIMDGVIYSGWQLFFNFYILQSGYSREFLGLVNSMPSAAALVFALLVGRISDRIGRKPAIIIGIAGSTVAMIAEVTVRVPALIVVAAFLNGVFNNLFIVSQAPLMMKLSDSRNRTMLFSLNYGLQTLSGAVGNIFAGQLPALFAVMLGVAEHSAVAYQAVLIASLLLGSTCLIPMWLLKEPTTPSAPPPTLRSGDTSEHLPQMPIDHVALPASQTTDDVGGSATRAGIWGRKGRGGGGGRKPVGVPFWKQLPPSLVSMTARMTAPQVLIGFGAAILIPYMNVFLKDRFSISDSLLGLLFSLSSLFIGVGSLLAPRLSMRLGGKVRAVVATQSISLVFLLMAGFAPVLWLSSVGLLLRTALMNMSSPLYSAFCMERTPDQHQGLVNSILNLSWNIGWSVGPFISGVVQQRYGFAPLFVTTSVLYGAAALLQWIFFKNTEALPLPAQPIIPAAEFVE
jgi:MFS family permease